MIGLLIWFISAFIAVIIWAIHVDNNSDFNPLVAIFTCVCPIYNTLYVITRFPRFCKELKNSNFWKQLKDM